MVATPMEEARGGIQQVVIGRSNVGPVGDGDGGNWVGTIRQRPDLLQVVVDLETLLGLRRAAVVRLAAL